ncbi:ATP-binding protein [Acidobacteria bacterium AH-259-A15]|nr:ATP-binding protein [Acidobacteria bacterium AH-259-A15]
MSDPIALIGQTNFRNKKILFGIKQKDRLSHMLLVGKTGSGKSTVLAQMMRSDLENGVGFALLDAHGDLADQVLGHVPKQRIQDVIYINPTKEGFSPTINLLDSDQKHLAVSQFLSIFQHLWPDFWGPRTEYLLRNSLLLLTEVFSGASLADVPRLLTDFAFRGFLVSRLPPGDLRNFWEKEFAEYSKTFRNEAVAPILNKVGAVALNPFLRAILGQRKSDLDFRKILDRGNILIANLAKGSLGEDASSLLGSILLSKLILAGLSRADTLESKRRFFAVYADEAQQFLTESSLSLFSELRKYAVAGAWSTQYLASLPEKVREAILGNAGTLIVFALSGEDARALSQEFAPMIRMQDLVDLPAYHFYAKLKIDGAISKPFSAETIPSATSIDYPHVLQKLKRFRGLGTRNVTSSPDLFRPDSSRTSQRLF